MSIFKLLADFWRGSTEGRLAILFNFPVAIYNLFILGDYLRRATSGEEFSFWELVFIASLHLGLASFTFLFVANLAKKDRVHRSLDAASKARRECWEFLRDERNGVESAVSIHPAPLGWEETAHRLEKLVRS